MDSFGVRMRGADQALKALSIMEPEVAKRVKKEISAIGTELATYMTSLAQAEAPVSGWGNGNGTWPAWGKVSGSSSRRGAGVIVTPRSTGDARIAAMYEYIGNATKIRTTNGAALSRMFNERLGAPVTNSRRRRPGRLVRQTLNDKYPEAYRKLEEACNKAADEVNRRMP